MEMFNVLNRNSPISIFSVLPPSLSLENIQARVDSISSAIGLDEMIYNLSDYTTIDMTGSDLLLSYNLAASEKTQEGEEVEKREEISAGVVERASPKKLEPTVLPQAGCIKKEEIKKTTTSQLFSKKAKKSKSTKKRARKANRKEERASNAELKTYATLSFDSAPSTQPESKVKKSKDSEGLSSEAVTIGPPLGLKNQKWVESILNFEKNRSRLPIIEIHNGKTPKRVYVSQEMVENILGERKQSDHHLSLNVIQNGLYKIVNSSLNRSHKKYGENIVTYLKVFYPGNREPVYHTFIFKAEESYNFFEIKLITAYRVQLAELKRTDAAINDINVKNFLSIKIENEQEFLGK